MKRALLLLACVPLAAQSIYPPDRLALLRRAVDEAYQLNHAEARAICQQYIARWPDDAAGYTYLARIQWSEELANRQLFTLDRFSADEFFSDEGHLKVNVAPAVEARFRKLSDDALARAKARLKISPEDRQTRFTLGVAYQNLASFEACLRTKWWLAVRYADQALKYHQELVSSSAPVADARVTTGISKYAIGSVPFRFRWLTFLLGYHGDKTAGKRELQIAAEQGELASADASVILVLLHTLDSEYDAAKLQLDRLHTRYPRNYLVHLEMAALESRRGRHAEAEKLYQEILEMVEARSNGYERLERAVVYSQHGVARRAAADYAAAEKLLRQSLIEPGAAERIKTAARLELGKTLDLMGRRKEALAEYRQVHAAEDFAGTRHEAGRLIKAPFSMPAQTAK